MICFQTLYTYPSNFRANKALIAAQYSGFKINIASNFIFGETNKSEAFLKKFPLGKVHVLSLFKDEICNLLNVNVFLKVPAFESQDGECIAESNAIAYFGENNNLIVCP